MRKIISITMVNNESEIIESFIRYNYNFLDEMVIIDNGCTDNTIKIVNKLISEGFNITVYDESLSAYDQFRIDNKYLNLIIDEKNPDIVIPLDADEFIASDNQNPRKILESLDLNKVYYVNWRWYVLTDKDNLNEPFIPKRLEYCLTKPAWNFSDNKPVTKVILPTNYYKKKKLKLTMGHHKVFGANEVLTESLNQLFFAHYRAISEDQIIYKTECYTIRDITTMGNNVETAQRTNQMYMIENGNDMWEAAKEVSYGGYNCPIVHNPINLNFCKKKNIEIKYGNLNDTISERLLNTGREVAIRAYNSERKHKEKKFVKPIILVLDGVRGGECLFPNPSNKLTILTEMFNVRGTWTDRDEISFLKVNYRLIVNSKFLKFLPHQYVVVPDTLDFNKTKRTLINNGIEEAQIISLKDYLKKLGFFKLSYCCLRFVPSMTERVIKYVKRNGLSNTIKKLRNRL